MSMKKRNVKWYAGRKVQLMRLAKQTHDPVMKRLYLRAFDYCDRKIAILRRIARQKAKLPVVCVLLLILFVTGCHTVSGMGTMIQGIGQDVKQASDGYMEKNK